MSAHEYPTTLEGGVFDGDQGTLVYTDERPERFWVVPCANPSCPVGKIHWLMDSVEGTQHGGEIYRFDREDAGNLYYVHADADLSGLPSIVTAEPVLT
jgi:hypothetical protein